MGHFFHQIEGIMLNKRLKIQINAMIENEIYKFIKNNASFTFNSVQFKCGLNFFYTRYSKSILLKVKKALFFILKTIFEKGHTIIKVYHSNIFYFDQ